MKKALWLSLIFIVSVLIICLCDIVLSSNIYTDESKAQQEEVMTQDFLVYKRDLKFYNADDSDLAVRNEDMNVAVTNPELYEFCKARIGKTVTITFKQKDLTSFEVIKVKEKEKKDVIDTESKEH